MKLFYEAENPKDFIIGFIAGVSLLAVIVSAFASGVKINTGILETKEPVVPIVRVECLNEKCDTTYVYNFNTK